MKGRKKGRKDGRKEGRKDTGQKEEKEKRHSLSLWNRPVSFSTMDSSILVYRELAFSQMDRLGCQIGKSKINSSDHAIVILFFKIF